MITFSLRRSFSLAYAGLLVTTAFLGVAKADDAEGVVRVRRSTVTNVTRGQSPQPLIRTVNNEVTTGTSCAVPGYAPTSCAAPVSCAAPTSCAAPISCAAPATCAAPVTCAAPTNSCDSTGSCCPTTSCCPTDSCCSSNVCCEDTCFSDCDPVIGRRFGRRCAGGSCGDGFCRGGRLRGGRCGGMYGDEFCGNGRCGGRLGRGCRSGCGGGGGTLIEREMAKTCAWARLKFGYFIPTGSCGYGTPPIGHYSMVYPVNPEHFDARDGQVYAAQGYGGPVSVPLAPVVNHTYNYGWGMPSSRLTPVSHPVNTSQADAYRGGQFGGPQGLQ